jgi:hypothetical protein
MLAVLAGCFTTLALLPGWFTMFAMRTKGLDMLFELAGWLAGKARSQAMFSVYLCWLFAG